MKRSARRGGPYGARLRSVYAEVQWQRFANVTFDYSASSARFQRICAQKSIERQ
jgi:hypothetical protein